jgi:uncharacterized membrane protein YfcA
MEKWIIVIVTFLAGMGAGLGTGFAGMSAAAVISPMLITFLGMDPYLAIGIALSSDVLASGASAITFAKYKNIDIKNGLILLVSVLLFTILGSYLSSLIPSTTMGNFSVFMTFVMGLRFLFKPVNKTEEKKNYSQKKKIILSILCGAMIGLICGFVGAGGGMMMLFVLTSILDYDIKKAVGTSVFVMSFTALTGAISHFSLGGMPDVFTWVLCIVFTLLWAKIAAIFANKVSPKTLNRVIGIILSTLGIVMFVFTLITK